MSKAINIKEVSSFLGMLNNITQFSNMIRSSRNTQELEHNLNAVDNKLMELKQAKTPYISKKVNDIERISRVQGANKYKEVENKVQSIHQEAVTLQNILSGLHNYSNALLQSRNSETEIRRDLLEQFYTNYGYVDSTIKDMLNIQSLDAYITKALTQQTNPYVTMDKRGVAKLQSIYDNTGQIISTARRA